jgi:hypothetical protein
MQYGPHFASFAIGGVVMKTAIHHSPVAALARLLLGVLFVFHGLNGFLHFLPQDFILRATTPVPEPALAFVSALVIAGYVFPLINVVEIFAGALLLSNHLVPLALTVLAPIVVNMVLFYVVLAGLAPAGTALAAAMLTLSVYLAWTYRDAFRPMLTDHGDGKPTITRSHTELRTA